MDFTGKTAIITGAAVGIGRAVALQLAEGGANVVLVDYNPDSLSETEREIKNISENVIIFLFFQYTLTLFKGHRFL